MKNYILSTLLLLSTSISIADSSGYFYSVSILSSGTMYMNCERVNGSYGNFVAHINKLFSPLSMTCTDSNQYFKTQFNVMCGDGNGGMINSFWFKTEKECEKEKIKREKEQ